MRMTGSKPPRDMAARLAEACGLSFKQARFGAAGWYERLIDFPAVLLDSQGYLFIRTKEEYEKNPLLRERKQLNVVGFRLASIPGYRSDPRVPQMIQKMGWHIGKAR